MFDQLIKQSQELIVIDPSSDHSEGHDKMSLMPLEVLDHSPFEGVHNNSIEAQEDPIIIEVKLETVPGAGNSPDPEVIEVHEDDDNKKKEDEPKDENDAQSKKNKKWDWGSRGATGFIAWIKERCDDVPKHSGQDSAGLERAIAYLEKLDNEISKSMRLDLDSELDANKIEEVRATIDNGIERLHDRLDKVKKNKKIRRKKSSDFDYSEGLIKEAQKITGVQGVYVTVPLLISGIARVCINSVVSAGHDLEVVYADQTKKYKLNDREKSEVKWLLFDMGYPLRGDRGFIADSDEEIDTRSSDNYDYAASYRA